MKDYRTLLCFLASALMLLTLTPSCSEKNSDSNAATMQEEADTSAEEASAVALKAYTALYNGRPERFVECCSQSKKFTGTYHDELLQGCRRHLVHVDTMRHGVTAVRVSKAQKNNSLGIVEVCLTLDYGNGTSEEILVPMVKTGGEWMIK
jgi:hypothetical protein